MNPNSSENSQKLREIYNLLGKLCQNLAGNNHKNVLKTITSFITESHSGIFSTNSNCDDNLVVGKIKDLLLGKSEEDLTRFLESYEELTKLSSVKFRHSILTLLLSQSEMQDSSKEIRTIFNLPKSSSTSSVRTAESTLDTVFRKININNNNTLYQSESNLKLASFRKIGSAPAPSTTSDIHQDDTETSSLEDIIQEIIYALTGNCGKYMKKDVSGEFKLDIRARHLSMQEAGMLLRLAETGFIYNEIQKFATLNGEFFFCGLFGQGLVSEVQKELTQYYGLVAFLEEKLNAQRNTKYCVDSEKEEILSLIKVMSWLSEPSYRLNALHNILKSCKNLKGGPLLSVLYMQLHHGDSVVRNLAKKLLTAASIPMQSMLSKWLLDGEIEDPYEEFFVGEIKEIHPDQLWHDKYRTMNERLPCFFPKCLVKKIAVTGVSINFLREVCQDKSPIKGREELKQCFEENIEDLFAPVADTKLHEMIQIAYLNTSKKVLDIATGTYRLMEHLHAMRKYLLLGQGDFISLLMKNLKDELDRPAKELYQHALFSIMAASVRTTSQFDDPEILQNLDVKLIFPLSGDKGWDIFTLKYTVEGPLATILERSMVRYQELFKPLWRAKQVEFVLSNIYKEKMLNSKLLRNLEKTLNPVTYRLHLYTSEMIHFINQIQYYILVEVIECSWSTFNQRVLEAQALDDILEAHMQFLETVKCGIYLNNGTSKNLYLNLQVVYDSIMKLDEWQKLFYEVCFKESESRKNYEDFIESSAKTGQYGVTVEKRLERDDEIKQFEQTVSNSLKTLNQIGNEYEDYCRTFLLMLASSNELKLQLFGIRLDFNEYYKKRDQRLNQPLTFEHMRMSITMSGSMMRGSFINSSRMHN